MLYMIFQGAAWIGINEIFMAESCGNATMLESVPLVMEGGYEGVTSSLEKMLIDAGNDRAPEAGEGLCCQA
jgi:hypothetical protein